MVKSLLKLAAVFAAIAILLSLAGLLTGHAVLVAGCWGALILGIIFGIGLIFAHIIPILTIVALCLAIRFLYRRHKDSPPKPPHN